MNYFDDWTISITLKKLNDIQLKTILDKIDKNYSLEWLLESDHSNAFRIHVSAYYSDVYDFAVDLKKAIPESNIDIFRD